MRAIRSTTLRDARAPHVLGAGRRRRSGAFAALDTVATLPWPSVGLVLEPRAPPTAAGGGGRSRRRAAFVSGSDQRDRERRTGEPLAARPGPGDTLGAARHSGDCAADSGAAQRQRVATPGTSSAPPIRSGAHRSDCASRRSTRRTRFSIWLPTLSRRFEPPAPLRGLPAGLRSAHVYSDGGAGEFRRITCEILANPRWRDAEDLPQRRRRRVLSRPIGAPRSPLGAGRAASAGRGWGHGCRVIGSARRSLSCPRAVPRAHSDAKNPTPRSTPERGNRLDRPEIRGCGIMSDKPTLSDLMGSTREIASVVNLHFNPGLAH